MRWICVQATSITVIGVGIKHKGELVRSAPIQWASTDIVKNGEKKYNKSFGMTRLATSECVQNETWPQEPVLDVNTGNQIHNGHLME